MRLNLKPIIAVAVLLIPALVTLFAIAMGAAGLVSALGDDLGRRAMQWVAGVAAMLLVADALLLLTLLGAHLLLASPPAPRARDAENDGRGGDD